MAARVTLYGSTNHPDIRRLQREMNVLYVDYVVADPRKDARAGRHLSEQVGEVKTLPLVEVERADGDGSVFLTNPDEPALRSCLLAEEILSVTAYWL